MAGKNRRLFLAHEDSYFIYLRKQEVWYVLGKMTAFLVNNVTQFLLLLTNAAVCADGMYYKYSFDGQKGGECKQESMENFLSKQTL